MATTKQDSIKGQFAQLIYSPKGEIEGVLLDVGNKPVQIVFKRGDRTHADAFSHLETGQRVVVNAVPQGKSPKGPAAHPIFEYVRLLSVDGQKPGRRSAANDATYSGVVRRINYARHGEANGVVLDTGDFIHLKPDGMARLALDVGDEVTATGDARPLSTGGGCAIEATRINGKLVRRG